MLILILLYSKNKTIRMFVLVYFGVLKAFPKQGEHDIVVETIDNLTNRSMKKTMNRVALHVLEITISYEILIMAYNFRKGKEKKRRVKCFEKEKYCQIRTNPFRFELFVCCF